MFSRRRKNLADNLRALPTEDRHRLRLKSGRNNDLRLFRSQPKEGATSTPRGRLKNPAPAQWRRVSGRSYRGCMNTTRFKYERGPGAPARLSSRKYSKWSRVSHIGTPLLRDSMGSGRRKIFAIVAPPMSRDFGGNPGRRVLIFDNHPDSLRLIFGPQANGQIDFLEPQRTNLWEFVLVAAVTFAAVFGLFWPLF
jgi:hypothetical protein